MPSKLWWRHMNFNYPTLFFCLGFASLLSGCMQGDDNDVHPESTYRIIVIEEHEYIFISRRPWAGDMAISHNANCNNPNHLIDRL